MLLVNPSSLNPSSHLSMKAISRFFFCGVCILPENLCPNMNQSVIFCSLYLWNHSECAHYSAPCFFPLNNIPWITTHNATQSSTLFFWMAAQYSLNGFISHIIEVGLLGQKVCGFTFIINLSNCLPECSILYFYQLYLRVPAALLSC